MAEITLQNFWAWSILLPLAWALLIAFSWRRKFKPFGAFLLRLTIITLLTVALAQPTLVPDIVAEDISDAAERLVVLVDQSASLGQTGQQSLRAEAARLTQEHPDAYVLHFANQPVLVINPLSPPQEQPQTTPGDTLDPTLSNLAEALVMGGELLNNIPGRLVLLSDGIPTDGDTKTALNQLVQNNIPVDVFIPNQGDIQAWQNFQNDVKLVDIQVPKSLRKGESFNVDVSIHTDVPTKITLNLKQPSTGTILAEDVVDLEAGLNKFSFSAWASELGPQTFRATIAADEDFQAENNRASAFTQVYPTSRILMIADDNNAGLAAGTLLQEAGYEVEIISAVAVPDDLSQLEAYDGMVLLNVSAKALKLEQMIAIQEFVQSLGRGLLVTGGRDSYDLGHYEDTPLAELLPVSLEPPLREERPPVALLLMLDHSGSMAEEKEDEEVDVRESAANRLTMAKEAVIRAVDFLGPQDLIGILIFDNRNEWVVPFQEVQDGAELLKIQQKIARIPPGGGTQILEAMEQGLPELIGQDTAASRLAVLVTDGKSFDGERTIDDYNFLVDQALESNITLSTIALGTDADFELMAHLAERGRGRYHFAKYPDELPDLTISESDILRTNALQEGDFGVAVGEPHSIIRGIFTPLADESQSQAPNINGYLAMTPRLESEIPLQIGQGDPLLSVWGYGLGRVAAWSSDTGEEWTAGWRDWPELSRFWGQVVGYTLPAPDTGLLQLTTTIEPDGTLLITVDGVTATGQPVDFAKTEAILTTPAGQQEPIRLQQVAPGRYERRVKLANPGAYQVNVVQARPNEPDAVGETGFVLPYSAEYALPAENSGNVLLTDIAQATGGKILALGQPLSSEIFATDQAADLTTPKEIWPWLLLIALLLWPLEIAWRRWGRLRIQ